VQQKIKKIALISLVLPFHNEERSLPIFIEKLHKTLDSLPEKFEVIFVDDFSSDNSMDIVVSLKSKFSDVKLIQLLERGGQTGAFQAAFKAAKGEFIIRMDTDLQDTPEDLHLFMDKLKEGNELVLGYRKNRKHNFYLKLLTNVFDLIVRYLFQTNLKSNSGSFIAFSAPFIKDIPLHSNDHRYLPLIALRRGVTRFCQIDVSHNDRTFGLSKYSTSKKIFLGIFELGYFYFRYKRGVYDQYKDGPVNVKFRII